MRQLIIGIFCCLLWQGAMAADVANLKHTVAAQTENIQKIQQSLTDLQTQLQKVSADFNEFKQQATIKIDTIATSNNDLQNKILAVSQSMSLAEQKVVGLQKAQEASQQGLVNRVSQTLENWSGYINLEVALVILGLIIVLLVWWLWHHHNKKKKVIQESTPSIDVSQGEYDLMNSTEGIPAKLNLARAYIEMGNKGEAQSILQEVLKQGNEEQQKEAQTLLDSCS